MKSIYVVGKVDKNTKGMDHSGFITTWKSSFLRDTYIFISDAISIIKNNHMNTSLDYIHSNFSY